jgi:hypothetical protein
VLFGKKAAAFIAILAAALYALNALSHLVEISRSPSGWSRGSGLPHLKMTDHTRNNIDSKDK